MYWSVFGMRTAFIMAVMFEVAHACLPGFYGETCLPCPAQYSCNGTLRESCPVGTKSMVGSRNCYVPLHQNITVAALPVVNFSANLGRNPSNETCGCFKMAQPLAVVLDVGRESRVAGIVTRRDRSGVWLKEFTVDYSLDNVTWNGVGGLYKGNNEVDAPVTNLFPHLVKARYFRVLIVEYFLWPGFRAAFLEAVSVRDRSVCPRRVNQVVVDDNDCTYACKNGTFRVSRGACVARASSSSPPPWSVQVRMATRHARLESKMHKFGQGHAVEFREPWRGSEMALKIDGRAWIAWSRQPVVLSREESAAVGANSSFLLLPYSVNVSVRIRIVWQSRLKEVELHSWTVHGRRNTSVNHRSMIFSWGGGSAMIGDLSALVSITCRGGRAVDAKYGLRDHLSAVQEANNLVPTAVHDVARSCAANVSHGVVWLREATELLGVDTLLGDFVRDECTRGVTAWVLPGGPRRGLKYAKVQATCQHLI
jgi:hypothetical protein